MPIISKISEKKLTAIIEPSGDGFVVSCPELDLATQGKTEEEAFNDIRTYLRLMLVVNFCYLLL
jgi:predicted RNase H-like HicB family nuclease